MILLSSKFGSEQGLRIRMARPALVSVGSSTSASRKRQKLAELALAHRLPQSQQLSGSATGLVSLCIEVCSCSLNFEDKSPFLLDMTRLYVHRNLELYAKDSLFA